MITDIRTVGVPVADQDRAVAFFAGTLGFETRLDAAIDETVRWLEVADAAAEHQRLVAAGVTTSELLAWDDIPPMFTFDDGNRFYVVADQAGASQALGIFTPTEVSKGAKVSRQLVEALHLRGVGAV